MTALSTGISEIGTVYMPDQKKSRTRLHESNKANAQSPVNDKLFAALRSSTFQAVRNSKKPQKCAIATESSSASHGLGVPSSPPPIVKRIDFSLPDATSANSSVQGIRRMPNRCANSIRTGQVVLDSAAVVKELIENALDAGATKIDIRMNGKAALERIIVADNGCGVHLESRTTLCEAHSTSKLQHFSDLDQISTYGFRGEALAAIASLAESVIVTTRTAEESIARLVVYNHLGAIEREAAAARSLGTTVQVDKIFARLPVRLEDAKKHSSRELGRCLSIVQKYALVAPHVRFECRVESEVKLLAHIHVNAKTSQVDGLRSRISSVLGNAQAKNMIPFSTTFNVPDLPSQTAPKDLDRMDAFPVNTAAVETKVFEQMYRVNGFISRTTADGGGSIGSGKLTGALQFLYLNGRPVELPRIAKTINEVYRRQVLNSHASPAYVIKIDAPTGSFDVNVSPDKRKVILTQESELLAVLNRFLENLWSPVEQLNIPVAAGIGNAYGRNSNTKPNVLGMPVPNRRCNGSKSCPTNQVNSNDSLQASPEAVQSRETFRDALDEAAGHRSVSELYNVSCDNGLQSDTPFNAMSLQNDLAQQLRHRQDKRGSERFKAFICRKKAALGSDARKKLVPSVSYGHLNPSTQFDEEPQTESPGLKHQWITNSAIRHQQRDCDHHIRDNVDIPERADPRMNTVEEADLPMLHTDVAQSRTFVDDKCEARSHISAGTVSTMCYSFDSIKARRSTRRILGFDKKRALDCSMDTSKTALEPPSQKFKFDKSTLSYESRENSDTVCGPETESEKRSAEQELMLTFKQEWFTVLKVIGQFNLGFIVCLLGDSDLFIVDQHASDEKFNYEDIRHSSVLHTQMLVTPLALHVSAEDELLVLENLDRFRASGFDIDYRASNPPTQRLYLRSQPSSKRTIFVADDLREIIASLKENGTRTSYQRETILLPPRVSAMFASRACRKSVMIGTPLARPNMTRIIRNMATLGHPWMCPHGRPTMRHLLNLDNLDAH